jgi:hypothetical protein
VVETTVKDFYAWSFDELVKKWDRGINVGGGFLQKLIFFPGSNIFLLLFVSYLLSLPHRQIYKQETQNRSLRNTGGCFT